ncbi:hypothetical protein FRC06_003591 [Ceratobasidium sp. 370]|nr:hypothetical protein FRC06_003591 [Ceratobasidium sp. 370]
MALVGLNLFKIISAIKSKLDSRLLNEIDYLAEAVSHVVEAVIPANRTEPTSLELLEQVRIFKGRFENAIDEYKNGREFRHYYYYILDVAHDVDCDATNDYLVSKFIVHNQALDHEVKRLRKAKRAETVAQKNKRIRELARLYGLRCVGHVDPDRTPFDVCCVDAYTHRPLDPDGMLINGINNDDTGATPLPPAKPTPKGKKNAAKLDPSVPPPALDSPFPADGFVTKEMLAAQKFTTYYSGTVYGFARAANNMYSMVWAVQFSPSGSFNDVEQEAVDVFIEYMDVVRLHAHEVKKNRAQNGNKARRTDPVQQLMIRTPVDRHGRLFGSGWRPGRKAGEVAGVYAPQSLHDKHNPDGYIDMHDKQEAINVAWMILQERISPRAVMTNVNTLADTAVPLFGSYDSDITTHGPSLGANMSVSMHDKQGCNFANSMHVDMDIDSLPEFCGKIFTFGQWINTKNGKLVEGEELRKAIPDGFFVLPGYRIALDLGGAAVVTAMWRGGMDLHGTTTSTVDLDSGITRWGMSIQTNKKLPNQMRAGKGAIFGAFDRLRAYYDAVFPPEQQP